MHFIAYYSPDAPRSEAWLVALYEPVRKGLRGLPIFITAATKEEAVAKAKEWWEAEVERQRKLEAGRFRLAALRRRTASKAGVRGTDGDGRC